MAVRKKKGSLYSFTIVGSIVLFALMLCSFSLAQDARDEQESSKHFTHSVQEDGATSPMTLPSLLDYAHAHAPALLTARARTGLADADMVEAEILFPMNPKLGVRAGGRTVQSKDGFEFGLSIQQQVEIAGERGLRLEAAKAKQRLSTASLQEIQWEVHVEVHKLFIRLLLAKEQRSHAKQFVASSKILRDLAAQQVKAGETSPLVELVAEADFAQTREILIDASQREQSVKIELASMIGWPTNVAFLVEGKLPPVKRVPEPSLLVRRMAEHHPSIRIRVLAEHMQQAELDLAEREAWPEPILGFSYNREASVGSNSMGANLMGSSPEEHVWFFNVTMPIPFWRTNQEGRTRAKVALDITQRERTETITKLRAQLLQTVNVLNASAERVELYTDNVVPRLEQNLIKLQKAFEVGEVNAHQVSLTRERLLKATQQYLNARVTYFETAAVLEGLIGTELWSVLEART